MTRPAAAQVRLITDEEARAPSQPAPTTRAITRGPGVSLLTPTEVPARSFALKLAFEPRGGTAIIRCASASATPKAARAAPSFT